MRRVRQSHQTPPFLFLLTHAHAHQLGGGGDLQTMERRAAAFSQQLVDIHAASQVEAETRAAEAIAEAVKHTQATAALDSLQTLAANQLEAAGNQARAVAFHREEELAAQGAEFARVSDAQLQSLSAAEELARSLRAALAAAEHRHVEDHARARALEARIDVLSTALESRAEEVLLGERAQAQLEASLTYVILECCVPAQQQQLSCGSTNSTRLTASRQSAVDTSESGLSVIREAVQ
jgi:hypothetical protein